MNVPTLLASILLASAAAVSVTLLVRPDAPPPAPDSAHAEVAALRSRIEQLEQQLAAAETEAVAVPAHVDRVAVPTVSDERIAAAVEAYLARRGVAGLAAGTAGGADGLPTDAKSVFSELAGTNFWENGDAWRKAYEAGLMDELIEQFEAAAGAAPNDPDTQMALANAYLSYLQLDNTKWPLSMKADGVFDHVLGLDERHWEARFSKAVSYTFWPDFLGKKNDAISQFETLVAQQEGMPAQYHEFQTYLFLGNLLQDKEPERAKEMWERGLRRHPGNAELLQKLGR